MGQHAGMMGQHGKNLHIAKKRFILQQSLYEILQILSISLFKRMPINQLFQQTQQQYFKDLNHNQLDMFD